MKPSFSGTAEERRLERRARLIDAARKIYGERGFHNATVKSVCIAAGLTERYFYESFNNSEALFIAMHKDTSERVLRLIEEAGAAHSESADECVRAMLRAYYEDIQRAPGSARLFAIDAGTISPTAREVCGAWRIAFGALLAQAQGSRRDSDTLVRHAVVRALLGIGVDWMESGFPLPARELVETGLIVTSILVER